MRRGGERKKNNIMEEVEGNEQEKIEITTCNYGRPDNCFKKKY